MSAVATPLAIAPRDSAAEECASLLTAVQKESRKLALGIVDAIILNHDGMNEDVTKILDRATWAISSLRYALYDVRRYAREAVEDRKRMLAQIAELEEMLAEATAGKRGAR